MFKWITDKIKTYGVSHAVDALDRLEKPLGDRIEASMEKFNELDPHGLAKIMIDEVQSLLRAYFGIKDPEVKTEVKK